MKVWGWREAARVLAPGGLFATTTWVPPKRNDMFRAQFGPLRAEVEAAGFRDVEVHPFHASFVIPSIDLAWAAMLENPGSRRLLGQCTHDELRLARAAYAKGMTERGGGHDRPVVLDASCNLLVARRG